MTLSSKLLSAPPLERLPYPALPRVVVDAAIRALALAWAELAKEVPRATLAGSHEDQITFELVRRLEKARRRGVDAFDARTFAAVIKSPELRDVAGASLWKRPDIVLRLVSIPADVIEEQTYGVFVECKRIDPPGFPVRLYGDEGITRFMAGTYAFNMREALLAAFVFDHSTAHASLSNELNRSGVATLTVPAPYGSAWPSGAEVLATAHPRAFAYLSSANSPGPITLLHVWLRP